MCKKSFCIGRLLKMQVYVLCRFLSTESEQLIWKSEGLPSDELSMENAMVILQVSTSSVRNILLVFYY